MAVSESYLNYVLDQLQAFGDIESKRMFGGVGLFHNGFMLGKIGNDVLRLKVDDSNKSYYEAYGMKPYHSESKKKGMPYWEVPSEVLENSEMLCTWAQKSYQAAVNQENN